MTGAIPNFQAGVTGSSLLAGKQAERKRRLAKAAGTTRSAEDSYEPAVAETEQVEAARAAEHATHEETLEDRQEHATGYDAAGQRAAAKRRPKLDLRG